ncbi:MAG: leishmanolysin-related zinc metalloendopeptidase [Alphaproteobacteria bacterium]
MIADGGDALDREIPVTQVIAPDLPVALDASLASADALFDGAVDLAALDQETADSLLNIVPVAEGGEFLDAAVPTGGGASSDGWNLEAGPAGLPEWHILTTDGTLLTADYTPRMESGDHNASDWGLDYAPGTGTGHQFSSAGDLIFLDFESYVRPEKPGGGSGKKDKDGNGDPIDPSDPSDPGVMSEYLSGPDGGYNILIDFKGTWTVDLQQAFIDAAEWISSFIVGDISDVRYRGQTIDDITITARLTDIDGAGGILGQAGPTAIRTADFLPATGIMEFDIADAATFDAMGLWGNIVFHEMMHTIGFGTVWDFNGLVAGSGTNDPTFTGAGALSEYQLLDAGATGVPLEWGYGSGTDESHWRESTFDDEVMTGFINMAGNYLSNMTIASLEDLGYDTTWAA